MSRSRIELFLEAMRTGNISNLPKPQSRVEHFLKGIATGDINNLPKPQSRIEECLDFIARNGSIGNGSSSGDYIVKNEKFSISCSTNNVSYLFTKEQEVLFDKDNSFVFNGEMASNDNSTKFCVLSNVIDIQDFSYEEFEGGRVHTTNLKNNLGINILSEVIREVKNG